MYRAESVWTGHGSSGHNYTGIWSLLMMYAKNKASIIKLLEYKMLDNAIGPRSIVEGKGRIAINSQGVG